MTIAIAYPITINWTDRYAGGAALLDEFDTLITRMDDALAEQTTARAVLAGAESEMAVIEASHQLGIEGKNEAERKARLVLALRDDAAFQTFVAAAREARATLAEVDRVLIVTRYRIQLVRAALVLLTPASGEREEGAR